MKKLLITFILTVVTIGASAADEKWRGDLNGDGKVNLADMVFLANAIKSGNTTTEHDLNSSGKIDDDDLQTLADIILSEKLTKNEGLNVGIGGWEDSGEDYGGTVGTRAASGTKFYLGDMKEDAESYYSLQFGISENDVNLSAILLKIKLPQNLTFSAENFISLDEDLLDGHKLYGKPLILQEEGKTQTVKFIIFSPELNSLKETTGSLGRIHYQCDSNEPMAYEFSDCELSEVGSENVVVPEVSSESITWHPIAVDKITVDPTQKDLKVGEEFYVSATIEPSNATDQNLQWTVSDTDILSITPTDDSSKILVKALKPATTTVTATTTNGKQASCNVVVKQPVVSIGIDGLPSENIYIGNTFQLTAKILPIDASDKKITWSSSNTAVASVDADGVVTAVAKGDAVVTATAADGSGVTATVSVKVNDILVSAIKIEGVPEGEIKIGDKFQLKATVLPDNATNSGITWSSSNTAVASVDADGLVTAVAKGDAVVTATAADGSGVTATVSVKVNESKPESILVSDIKIEGVPEGEIKIGDKFQLKVKVEPDNATNTTVIWSVDDPTIATVDADGNVEILKEGSTAIRATSTDGSGFEAVYVINATSGVPTIINYTKPVNVYDMQGHLLLKNVGKAEMDELGKGIYIIIQGCNSYKIIR